MGQNSLGLQGVADSGKRADERTVGADHAVDQAFIAGYREIIWLSVGLALLSTLSAQLITLPKCATP